VESVMLVGRLGQADLRRFASHSLFVRDNGVTLLDGALSEILFKILEADFDVELSTSSNDVLTRFLSGNLDKRVRLGEFSKTFDELGKITGRLDFDGNTHDGGDGILHHTDAVGSFPGGDSALLDQVLINTDEGAGVSAWNIGNGFDLSSHHDDGSLDVLDVEVSLGAGNVVGSQNADLLARGDGS